MPQRTAKRLLILLAWCVAIGVAISLDARVAQTMRSSGIEGFLRRVGWLREILKTPGEVWFTLVIAAALWRWHPARWRGAVLLLAGGTLSGLNGPIKWIAGRTRPFKLFAADGSPVLAPFTLDPFRGGIPGLFHQTNLSFPSGHAAWAFASAAALSILLPRWRWAFYLLAACVGAERVAENAHWLSDAVCAAALGVGCVQVVRWIGQRIWPPPEASDTDHGERAVPVAGDSCLQRAGEHPDAAQAR